MFHNNVAWKKKTTASCYDVTVGSYDGAEVCELVGTLILSNWETLLTKSGYKSSLKHSEEMYQCNSKKRASDII